MADDWTNKTVEGFDLLTVITMVEQCDPDYTIVRWVHGNMVQNAPRHPDTLPVAGEVVETCLQCAMSGFQRFYKQDPRVALIENAKIGNVVVLGVRMRGDMESCPRCQPGVSSINRVIACVRQK